MPFRVDEAWVLVRVIVAGVLAALVGWERERRDRAAGLRTHVVVAIASCLLLSLGDFLERHYAGVGNTRIDPGRILQALVSGVAFVGVAAVVVRNRGRVQGLTTAASLLATAGIGAAVALDLYVLALGVSLILFLVLSLLSRLEVKRHQPGAGEVDRGTGGDYDPLPD